MTIKRILVVISLWYAFPLIPLTKTEERLRPDERIVDWERVRNKIKNPPDWWVTLIGSMLVPFKKQDFTPQALDRSQSMMSMPARFTIKKGLVDGRILKKFVAYDIWKETRFDIIDDVLKMLVKYRCIVNDVDFLLDMADVRRGNFPVPVFMFAQAKTSHGIILMPDAQNFAFLFNRSMTEKLNKARAQYSWQSKKPIIFWRGIPHDAQVTSRPPLACPRSKLVAMSKQYDFIDAGFNDYYSQHIRQHRELENVFGRASYAAPADQLQYKYLVAIDGVTVPFSGLVWPLMSNSVVLKQDSDDVQWFHHMIKPYEHYVPVKKDMSDLPHLFNWLCAHDDQVQKISQNAQAFASSYLTLEDHLAYLAVLINTYAVSQNLLGP